MGSRRIVDTGGGQPLSARPATLAPPRPTPADFVVGALAIAGRRANAVGAVRLRLATGGLEIELVKVSGFSPGFAPSGVAEPVLLRVPYRAVRGLTREGRLLYLSLDAAAAGPYTRFALGRFTHDPGEALGQAFVARAWARVATWGLPLPFGALVAALCPASLVGGPLGRASVGLLAALGAGALLREVSGFWTWGGPLSDRLRDAFEADLAGRLGLAPLGALAPPIPSRLAAPAQPFFRPLRARPPALPAASSSAPPPAPPMEAPSPALSPSRAEPSWSEGLRGLYPLARPALGIAAAAVIVVGGMAFYKKTTAPRTEPLPPPVEWLRTGIAGVVRGIEVGLPEPDPIPDRCGCARADSPLWEEGIPRVSILPIDGDDDVSGTPAPRPNARGRLGFDFEVAIVNNASRSTRDVTITLTFARRNKSNERVNAVDRGLFWGDILPGGSSVHWHVKAPGTEMRIDTNVSGTLEEAGLGPAKGDAFYALMTSRYRAVRLQAATMLAYLRDKRAAEAVANVGGFGGPEEERLQRLRRASAPVILCDVARRSFRLDACLFNAGAEPKTAVSMRELSAPRRLFSIKNELPPGDGIRVSFAVESPVEGELAVLVGGAEQ